MAKRSGTGQGGKSFQDREKAAKVRGKLLDCLDAILNEDPKVDKWPEYKKRILEKMATSALPRLNEHTGEDGGAIKIEGVVISVRK